MASALSALEELAQFRAQVLRPSRAYAEAVRAAAAPEPVARQSAGLLLMVVGALVMLTSTAFLGYVRYVDWQLSHVVSIPASSTSASLVTPLEAGAPPPGAASFNSAAPSATAAVAPTPLSPPTRLRIASIDLDAPVKEVGTRVEKGQVVWEMAAHAVGWYRMTTLPGQAGNIVMAGHISSPFRGEGSIFRRLPDVRVGDVVFVETEASVFAYQVVSRDIVSPDAVELMGATPTETLTLLTCYPDLVYSHRLVVRAVPMEIGPRSAASLSILP